ncbi:MAG: DUF362 domain-containing protein [Firmicutes bacterium]|nr:DUF362 domain-containing protein [Bacillota bacterium]
MKESKVYFTHRITKENIVKLYEALGVTLKGKVAVKVHSGEKGNQNYLRPEFLKDIIEHVNGTVVECNTAYDGERNDTEKHKKLMEEHGWSDMFSVDILDSEGEMALEIPEGQVIKKNYVGSHMKNYDAMLVVSHFKGHPMGGYGGALKNISIGLASSHGKAYIHGAGKPEEIWSAPHDLFLESMADASKSIVDYYQDKIVFINIMCNLSVDCDCCAKAEDPCMQDIGMLASLDPVALDQACLDLVYQSTDPGKDHLMERIESRNGIHTIEAASQLNIGSRVYQLISVD